MNMANASRSPSRVERYTTRLLLACLLLLSAAYLLLTPERWWFSNDDAIYLGSAESMLESGAYRFNGLPNLMVYPGTSTVLALALALFGRDFYLLNLLFVAIAVSALWAAFAVLRATGGQLLALMSTLLLGMSELFMSYVYYLRSDHLFLLLLMATLYCWQRFERSDRSTWLYVTAALTALSPMVRFEGLILCAAFVLAFGWKSYRETRPWILRTIVCSLLVITPFALWTLRNLLLYSPEAHNMALSFFFGLRGPALYAGQVHAVDLGSEWSYPLLRWLTLVTSLVGRTLGLSALDSDIARYGIAGFSLYCFLIGLRPWYTRASLMERVLFLTLLIFTVYRVLDITNARTIVVHTRYFLSLLPFIILIGAMGFRRLISDLGGRLLRSPSGPVLVERFWVGSVVVLVMLSAYTGLPRLMQYDGAAWHRYWDERYQALAQCRRYINDNIPPGTVIAGTDWGAVPYLTGRRTITVIDSPARTLRRIVTNGAEYLVVFLSTQAGIRPDHFHDGKTVLERHPYYGTVTELVRDYPQVFELVMGTKGPYGQSWIAIFRIHLDEAEQVLKAL